MKTRNFCILLFMIAIFFSCKKVDQSPVVSKSCRDFTIGTSSVIDTFVDKLSSTDYIFNENDKLEKIIRYDNSLNIIEYDSFAYVNGNMVKSWYSLNGINTYTTSEYEYIDNKLTKSRYYLGSTLIVHSSYVIDSLGRLTSYTQFADNMTYQYTPTYTLNFTYDNNSNLRSINNTNGVAGLTYSNYDNNPNPYYKLPFDFAYDVWKYCIRTFSKNNYQLRYTTSPTDSLNITYSFTYGADGRVLTSKAARLVQPANQAVNRDTFEYKCKL